MPPRMTMFSLRGGRYSKPMPRSVPMLWRIGTLEREQFRAVPCGQSVSNLRSGRRATSE